MYTKTLQILGLVLATVLHVSAYDAISDDEMRIYNSMSLEELLNTEIATGVPISQKFAPAVTSILTADEIQKSGARTLHEALEQVPGVHVYPSEIDIMTPKVNIRGIATGFNAQVLFLIDGVPMNDLLNGHPGYAFRMPVSIIHRIEVIRGPGSALHGADAFSGVVNIITKKSDTITDQVGVRYGSFNTYEAWVNKSVVGEAYELGLALSVMGSKGDDGRIIIEDADGASGQVESRYETAFLHADLHYKEFDLNVLLERDRDLGLGDGHLHILDHRGSVDRDRIITDLTHTSSDILDDTIIKTKLNFSYLDSQPTYYPRNSWQEGKPQAEEYVGEASVMGLYTGIDQHTIQLKVGYKYGKLDPTQYKNFGPGAIAPGISTDLTDNAAYTYMLEQIRRSYYVLAQDEWKVGEDLALTVGLRFDEYSDFGSTLNPRLALVWEATDTLMVKTMYGRAFRAPTFGELYLINNPQLKGNPNLSAETIDTYEIAFNHHGLLHTRLNLFYYEAKDLIDYVGPLPSEARNMYEQEGYGGELEVEYSITEGLNVRGNYSYQHSEDSTTGERVANVPSHQAYAQVQYALLEGWNINGQYFYIGKQYRESTDTRGAVPAYDYFNMTVEKRSVIDGLDVLLSVRNLLDEEYSEPGSDLIPYDYPMEGRSIFAELRYRF